MTFFPEWMDNGHPVFQVSFEQSVKCGAALPSGQTSVAWTFDLELFWEVRVFPAHKVGLLAEGATTTDEVVDKLFE